MNKKPFLFIFLGVVAAGLICLVAGLAIYFSVSGNPVATVVSLFASIAGGIMSGAGLIALLICLLVMIFGKGNKDENCNKDIAQAEGNQLGCDSDANEE